MEKNTTALPKDFIGRIENLERQLAALKEELAAFQAASAAETPAENPAEASAEAVDIDIDIIDIPDIPDVPVAPELPDMPAVEVEIPLPEPEDLPAEGMTIEPVPEEEAEPVAELVVEPVVEPEPEPAPEPAPAPAPEPEPAPAPAPAPVPAPAPEPAPAPAPAPEPEEDLPLFAEEKPAPAPAKPKRAGAAEGSYAWKSARPGMPVKNIRSAISLFDRALFINTLFKEDYALYDKTIGELNELTTLDEAVDYVSARFPDWNFGSDVVYSFMMAIRKKLG